jgi:ribose-phosphate pyrophosphokinase
MILFSGRSNPVLSQGVSEYLGMPLGRARINEFPDGEILVKLEEDVRGKDVFIMQSTSTPVNDMLMELLIFIDCAKRASAHQITAVIPYFGYARQDRKDEGRVPITAKLTADLLMAAGAHRILVLDLHANQIQGFFNVPVDNLLAEPVLSKHYAAKNIDNLVVVSPDVGNVKRAKVYARRLGGALAIIDKERLSGESVKQGHLIGNVKDKTVLMVDDMISTAGTIAGSAVLCKELGAKKVLVGTTHAVLCGPAIERLSNAPIDELVVTDTIALSAEKQALLPNLKRISVAPLIGEAIHRIHNNESVSSLFLR